MASKRPLGTITTLLDLTNRDLQENDLFPLSADQTWFTRDTLRRVLPFTPIVQEIPFRGPAAFGQRFSFDIGSILTGDLLLGTVLQIRLGHWLDAQSQLLADAGKLSYDVSGQAWEYANSLGTAIIAQAELEIDGKTIETIDGDFINTFSLLYPDYNSQFGIAYDHTGRISIKRLVAQQQPRLFPTEAGVLHCPLPFFFMRTRYQDALPMIAIREGLARIHITLRPFDQCVRSLAGTRPNCTDTPLEKTFQLTNTQARPPQARQVKTGPAPPEFESLQLITYGSILTGPLREKLLRDPFEVLHREVQTFTFDEPLKYSVGKRLDSDTIRVQLPLEANHPIEEIVWFVRRKGVADNNAWTNYTAFLENEFPKSLTTVERTPMLRAAAVQVNGITLCEAEEEYFRDLIGQAHRGGYSAYSNFIYGYPIARRPGEHQPSGSMNASRVNSLRLLLDVRPPGEGLWEVKVFCIALNWLRFENGMANAMFED
jgi:hypothetical protein